MNKTITQKLSESIQNAWRGVRTTISRFADEYDIASTPSFFIFMAVVTAGVIINFMFLRKEVGDIEAGAISALFEIGIFAWKVQGHRVKNSVSQQQIVNVATWMSTLLALLMLVASLTQRFAWGPIVVGAALVHIVGYLLFDQNDVIRANKRLNKMEDEYIVQKNIQSDHAINKAEADLRIIHKITAELTRLRREYSHLPVNELEFVLEETRKRLLREYNASGSVDDATRGQSDVNGDNMVGGVSITQRPQPTQIQRPVNNYASRVESPNFPNGGENRR